MDFPVAHPGADSLPQLTLEWSLLSRLTGNDTYRQLSENSAKHIAQLKAPLPGFAAQGIDPSTGNFVGAYVTWGGGSDSYLEYLLKYPRLNPNADPVLLQTWQTAVDTSIKFLLKVSTVGDFTYLADFEDDRKIRHIGSHLACFHGGNWILGGKLLNNQTIFDIGLKLADACWNTYASTAYVLDLRPSLLCD
jgi:mannosyl-oligosaccharide alpha-1,2-mannosidase